MLVFVGKHVAFFTLVSVHYLNGCHLRNCFCWFLHVVPIYSFTYLFLLLVVWIRKRASCVKTASVLILEAAKPRLPTSNIWIICISLSFRLKAIWASRGTHVFLQQCRSDLWFSCWSAGHGLKSSSNQSVVRVSSSSPRHSARDRSVLIYTFAFVAPEDHDIHG